MENPFSHIPNVAGDPERTITALEKVMEKAKLHYGCSDTTTKIKSLITASYSLRCGAFLLSPYYHSKTAPKSNVIILRLQFRMAAMKYMNFKAAFPALTFSKISAIVFPGKDVERSAALPFVFPSIKHLIRGEFS